MTSIARPARALGTATGRVPSSRSTRPADDPTPLLRYPYCECRNRDGLPRVRAFMHGPKWRRHFNVTRGSWHGYMFTLEDEIRERVLEELRPGIVAQWSDPRHG